MPEPYTDSHAGEFEKNIITLAPSSLEFSFAALQWISLAAELEIIIHVAGVMIMSTLISITRKCNRI